MAKAQRAIKVKRVAEALARLVYRMDGQKPVTWNELDRQEKVEMVGVAHELINVWEALDS